jgi:hypothetical protein
MMYESVDPHQQINTSLNIICYCSVSIASINNFETPKNICSSELFWKLARHGGHFLKKILCIPLHCSAVYCSNLQTSNKVALSHSPNLQHQGEPHGPFHLPVDIIVVHPRLNFGTIPLDHLRLRRTHCHWLRGDNLRRHCTFLGYFG